MPSEVQFGQVSSPNDLNQLVDILSRKVGQQEAGKYGIDQPSYATGAEVTCYYQSQSRNTVPVSVSVDSADAGPNTCNAPSTANLTAGGCLVKTTSTAIALKVFVLGNITIQY
jgi:hypothetical protein